MITTDRLDKNTPWPGLLAFTEATREFFHGREEESDDLSRLVRLYRLTVLFGESGLGKTSLLKAGLFPLLRQYEFLPLYLRINYHDKGQPLIEQLWEAMAKGCDEVAIVIPPKRPDQTVWEYLHQESLTFKHPSGYEVTPVFVLDQFEELFTRGQDSPATQRFIEDLGDLIENRVPLSTKEALNVNFDLIDTFDLKTQKSKVILSFREDYLPNFEPLKGVIRDIFQNSYRLTPMNGQVAKGAILASASHLMSMETAEKIVRVIAQTKSVSVQPLEKIEVVPALLSLFCQGLNEYRLQNNQPLILPEQVSETVRETILDDFYHHALEGISGTIHALIEEELIDGGGYRKSYPKSDATAEYHVSPNDIDRLITRRLLQKIERYGATHIELAHDVLTKTVKENRDKRRILEAKRKEELQLSRQRLRMRIAFFVIFILVASLGYSAWSIHVQKKIWHRLRLKNQELIDNRNLLWEKNQALEKSQAHDAQQTVLLQAKNGELQKALTTVEKAKQETLQANHLLEAQKAILVEEQRKLLALEAKNHDQNTILERQNRDLNSSNAQLNEAMDDLTNFATRVDLINRQFYDYALPDVERLAAAKKITILDQTKKNYAGLSLLILKSPSMSDEQRQGWFDKLPTLSDSAIMSLYEQLDQERQNDLVTQQQQKVKVIQPKSPTLSLGTLNDLLTQTEKALDTPNPPKETLTRGVQTAQTILSQIKPLDAATQERCYVILAHYSKEVGSLDQSIRYQAKLVQRYQQTYEKNPTDAQAKSKFAMALGTMSWYFLLNHNFTKASDTALLALKLSAGQNILKANLAHALLFHGHDTQAEQIYRDNQYKMVGDTQKFKDEVLSDFKEMEKYGLPTQPMKKIEQMYHK
jgi:hypothetical protein